MGVAGLAGVTGLMGVTGLVGVARAEGRGRARGAERGSGARRRPRGRDRDRDERGGGAAAAAAAPPAGYHRGEPAAGRQGGQVGAPGGAAAVTLRLQARGWAGRAVGGHRLGRECPRRCWRGWGLLRGWAERGCGFPAWLCCALAGVSSGVPAVLLLLLEGLTVTRARDSPCSPALPTCRTSC